MYTLDGLRLKVFEDRYALRDREGNQLEHTPEEMWKRVATAIAAAEVTEEKRAFWADEFYRALDGFQFVPAGRILSGAGSGYDLTFYNCFVIPSPDDSRGGIFESVKTMVEIMSRSGGVGVNLSTLRPRGARVKGVNGTASGAVSFGGLYSYATGLIIQGGSRRGALMLMLNDDHPDIEEFVTVKRTMGLVTNANLSVCISDRLMEAVKNDADWDLQWNGTVYKTIKARYLWNLICESAWASGEPGLYFMERANKRGNTWYFEKLISTNPCGEQPLGAWSVCNLGAINLAAFAKDGRVDYERLGWAVRTAVRFLDNVIEVTGYPFPQNREAQMNIRRTGLSAMGLGDFLIKLKLRYGSPEALALVREVYRFIRDEAYRASVEVSKEKGPFPKFDPEKYLQGHFIRQLPADLQAAIGRYGIRNAVLLTQAPTGTTSLLSGVSSGIEPVYDFVFIRKDRIGEHEVHHSLYKDWLDAHASEPVPDYFVNAKQLTPEEHIGMQAAIQEFVDSSISKTVNAPEEHTPAQVATLYEKAYELGCKGVTYFRENSRDISVLYSKDDKGKKAKEAEKAQELAPDPSLREPVPTGRDGSRVGAGITPRTRPAVTIGKTYKITTGYGTLYVTVNDDEEARPFEVFATIGKTGGFFAAKSEAICRLISLSLRSGISVTEVIDQLKGIRGPMPSWTSRGMVLSIPDGIAQILEEHTHVPQATLPLDAAPKIETGMNTLPEAEVLKMAAYDPSPLFKGEGGDGMGLAAEAAAPAMVRVASIANTGFAPQCPECSAVLAVAEGCMTCHSCGYSKCG